MTKPEYTFLMWKVDTWLVTIASLVGFVGTFTLCGGWITPLGDCKNIILASGTVLALSALLSTLAIRTRAAIAATSNVFFASSVSLSIFLWHIAKAGGGFGSAIAAASLSFLFVLLSFIFVFTTLYALIVCVVRNVDLQTSRADMVLALQAFLSFALMLLPLLFLR